MNMSNAEVHSGCCAECGHQGAIPRQAKGNKKSQKKYNRKGTNGQAQSTGGTQSQTDARRAETQQDLN
jgi:hypothetical protein